MEPKLKKFITIEGGDGAGKSTFIPVIKQYLESKGEKVLLTREPGGTELGETLRKLLLNDKMDVLTETLLMFAARSEHVATKILPALNEDVWVICDRFTDSTMAYQCAAKGLAESSVRILQDLVQKDLKPGITFVFDVPLSISKARLFNTGKTPDKFESESDEFFERVALGFKSIVKRNPNRCKLIDSSRSIDDTTEQVLLFMDDFYNQFSK